MYLAFTLNLRVMHDFGDFPSYSKFVRYWQRDDTQVSWLNFSTVLCLIVNIYSGDKYTGICILCQVCCHSEHASESEFLR